MRMRSLVFCALLTTGSASAQPPQQQPAQQQPAQQQPAQQQPAQPRQQQPAQQTQPAQARQQPARQGAAGAASAASEGADAGAAEREVRALVERGDRRAVVELRQRVRQGLPPALLEVVIAGLARTRRGDAVPALEELSRYRRPAIRVKVAEALAELGAASGARHLARMLDDPSPAVRAAAAEALGRLGPRPVMNELVRAAKRGVPQALLVVGAQATPVHVARIVREVDATSCDALSPALQSFATRSDLSPRVRTGVVQKLGEVGTPGAQRLLQQIIGALPEGDRVRQAAEEAMNAAVEAQENASEAASTEGAERTTAAPEAAQ